MTGICSNSKTLLIGSILVMVIIGTLTLVAYNSENDAIKGAVKDGMKATVGVMASQVNASEIAGLKPGDETSPQYINLAKKLRTMRSMDDHILNAYILKVNPDQSVTFLVDDLYPEDPQGSAKIGEISTAPKSDIIAALSGPVTSAEPYTTKYGSFMTAYAPIDDSVSDSSGNTVAVLAIDLTAMDYTGYTTRGGIIIFGGLVSMVLAVGAIGYFGTKPRKAEEACNKKP
jgi:hypothetical protein